uniref:Uncharacterized protein n=1 Tax=Arundo donax TaxID=35708 RepID=A0A0A9BY20_ARUDO
MRSFLPILTSYFLYKQQIE